MRAPQVLHVLKIPAAQVGHCRSEELMEMSLGHSGARWAGGGSRYPPFPRMSPALSALCLSSTVYFSAQYAVWFPQGLGSFKGTTLCA